MRRLSSGLNKNEAFISNNMISIHIIIKHFTSTPNNNLIKLQINKIEIQVKNTIVKIILFN